MVGKMQNAERQRSDVFCALCCLSCYNRGRPIDVGKKSKKRCNEIAQKWSGGVPTAQRAFMAVASMSEPRAKMGLLVDIINQSIIFICPSQHNNNVN